MSTLVNMNTETFGLEEKEDAAAIAVNGRFNFQVENEFEKITQHILDKYRLTLDFNQCEYVDSSGIRMLIKLAKSRPLSSEKIKIINCNQTVKDVFTLVNIASVIDIDNC